MLAMEKLTGIIPKQLSLRTCLISLVPLLIFAAVAVLYQSSPADVLLERLVYAVGTAGEPAAKNHNTSAAAPSHPPTIAPPPSTVPVKSISEELLDGLLTTGFDNESCISRYKSHIYRKRPSPHKPSEHLIAKLRSYESLHRRCGPGTKPYSQAITKLAESKNTDHRRSKSEEEDCKYIIWVPVNGLGNRMLSLVSTFLYAMLTDRVLLVELKHEMSGLFCEPFLNSTWESPTTFSWRRSRRDQPITNFGEMLRNPNYHTMTNKNTTNNDRDTAAAVPPVAFVTLRPKVKDQMKNFITDKSQTLLHKVRVLILTSDQYFVASLFLTPSFHPQLDLMFPEKQTVFHHLGRYLYLPANPAWNIITQFYQTHLSKADTKIGLQIRIFNPNTSPIPTVMEQLLACSLSNHLLPELATDQLEMQQPPATNKSTKAIFVASLYPDFSNKLKTMYESKPTKTGERVEVFQATHERVQRSRDSSHLVKAFSEMYLLSLCDVLVTSAKSTFGYVAHGLGGVKPWVLPRTGTVVQNPPCFPGWSMDPCFHYPQAVDGRIMRNCRDWRKGVNMVGEDDLVR